MHEEVLRELSTFAAGVDVAQIPSDVRHALERAVLDSIGVALAGADTPEVQRLLHTWPRTPGPCSLWGGEQGVNLEAAVLLNGVALCVLELDEGNKFARGHPGAHVFPAAFAEAERVGASGPELLSAALAGYEVAARVARAFHPVAGLHPHGTWGAVGAAVAVGRLNGFTPRELAEAIDGAAGLVLASPFSSATDGSFVRNVWVGSAGLNGVTAARLVEAGLGSVDGTGEATFGAILGRMDGAALVEGLGVRWEIVGGYFKRHSSCNYTHPPADAAIEIRERFQPTVADVVDVEVATHHLAVPLAAPAPANRLAAMFSVPHVVAVALSSGACAPESFAPAALDRCEVRRLRSRVRVVLDPEIDARLPAERGARVTVRMRDGTVHEVSVPNPVGDADFFPLSLADVHTKLQGLIGASRADVVAAQAAALSRGEGVRAVLAHLSAAAADANRVAPATHHSLKEKP